MSRLIFLVAGEPSGDALGADLILALRARDPSLYFAGVGGTAMAQAGAPSLVDIEGLSVLGFIDGLKAYGRVKRAVQETVQAIIDSKAKAAVLIDSWGFTLRVAQGVRARAPEIKIVKYVGPQVWATRPGRAKTLAQTVDHLICIHDFEPDFYKPYGLDCTVCGHPAIGRFHPGDARAFRVAHKIAADQRLVVVLPGSRASEIKRIGPTLWRAAEALRASRPDVKLVLVAAGPVAAQARAQAPDDALIVDEHDKDDCFAAAHLALAASGTVTTEVALQGAPVIVGYKLGWITWGLARLALKTRFVSLMNVAAQAEVAPEYIQTRFTTANLIHAGARLLDDEPARQAQIAAQNRALDLMGRGGRPAAEIAADAVLKVMAG